MILRPLSPLSRNTGKKFSNYKKCKFTTLMEKNLINYFKRTLIQTYFEENQRTKLAILDTLSTFVIFKFKML